MAEFLITALNPKSGETTRMVYNNITSSFVYEKTGVSIADETVKKSFDSVERVSKNNPLRKTTPKTLKISLGLNCNYECEYCNQKHVVRNDENTGIDNAVKFLESMPKWVLTPPEQIEFWGGEPFVYYKTLKFLAENLREKYPNARFLIITNGSLLTKEINEWLEKLGFNVGISHDGPGQSVRGPDPLLDPEQKKNILDLYYRLKPLGRCSFNTMVNSKNQSRAEIQKFFVELTGDEDVGIGEGGFIDAYDEGGVATSLTDDQHKEFRNRAFHEIRTAQTTKFGNTNRKIIDFIDSIKVQRPADALGQKCGMDKSENIAVDLNGNVLTCQNVSSSAVSFNGELHKIGTVDDFDNIKLKTATHWSFREECSSCPVLQICKGSCMFLQGPLWDISCNNSYSDAIPIFAAGVEFLTGYVPIHIEGSFREERKHIWDPPVDTTKKKIIPILMDK